MLSNVHCVWGLAAQGTWRSRVKLLAECSGLCVGQERDSTYWRLNEQGCPKQAFRRILQGAAATSLDLTGFAGLSEDDARRRIAEDGLNEIASQQKRGLFAIGIEVVREPMFLMLVAAGALYLLMGSPGDALMLLGFVFVVMAITIIQERRTERALDALRDLSSPRALVIRGGVRRRLAGREVARGDILVLSEGDRVPADAILRRAINLSVDESLLTGESVPVRKTPSAEAKGLERPGGDDLPSVYSGTLVTAGQGIAEVVTHRGAYRTRQDWEGLAANPARGDVVAEGDGATGSHARRGGTGGLRHLWSSFTPSREAARRRSGKRACWPASRWQWPFCRRSSR